MNYQKKALLNLIVTLVIFAGIALFIFKQDGALRAQLIPIKGSQTQTIYSPNKLFYLEGEPGAFAPMKWGLIHEDQAYPIRSKFSFKKSEFLANPDIQALEKTDPDFVNRLTGPTNYILNEDYGLLYTIPFVDDQPQGSIHFTLLDRANHQIISKELNLQGDLINQRDLQISSVQARIINQHLYALVNGFSHKDGSADYHIYQLDLSDPEADFKSIHQQSEEESSQFIGNWEIWNDRNFATPAKNASLQAPYVELKIRDQDRAPQQQFKYFDLKEQKWQEASFTLKDTEANVSLLAATQDDLFFLINHETGSDLISYDLHKQKASDPYPFDEAMQDGLPDYSMEVTQLQEDGTCQLLTSNHSIAEMDLKTGQASFLGQYRFKEGYQEYLSLNNY